MNAKLVAITATAIAMACAMPVAAKTKSGGTPAKGVYCSQGPYNVFVPASQFGPRDRKRIKKGTRLKFNIAGIGPVWCTGY